MPPRWRRVWLRLATGRGAIDVTVSAWAGVRDGGGGVGRGEHATGPLGGRSHLDGPWQTTSLSGFPSGRGSWWSCTPQPMEMTCTCIASSGAERICGRSLGTYRRSSISPRTTTSRRRPHQSWPHLGLGF
jgi:hypothetical protein